MKKKSYRKTIIISAVTITAAIIALAGAKFIKQHSYAHDAYTYGEKYHHHHHHQRHKGKYHGHKKNMTKWIRKTLIKEQSNQNMEIVAQRWFNRLDADNNAVITKDDIKDINHPKINKIHRRFNRIFDTNKDGNVEQNEYQNTVNRMIRDADQNNDQTLSKQEIKKQLKLIFGKMSHQDDRRNNPYSNNGN